MGPWGPKGPMPPRGLFWAQGPHQRHRGTQGKPPETPGGSGDIFGKTRILASRRPPASGAAGGLAAAFSGLAAAFGCLAAAAAGPAAAASFCLRFSTMPPAVFFRQKMAFFKILDIGPRKKKCSGKAFQSPGPLSIDPGRDSEPGGVPGVSNR